MKIKLIKYNTFILCLYMNTFILTIIFEILGLNFPIPLVYLLLVFCVLLRNKLTIISLTAILFLMLIIISMFFYQQLDWSLIFLYIKYLIITITSIFYANLKISLKLIKKYLKVFLSVNLVFLVFILKNKILYENVEFTYMDWGYNCLPIVLFYSYYYQETLKYRYLLMTLISISLLFLFGSRFGFLIGFIGVIFFLYQSKNKVLKLCIILGTIFCFFITMNLKNILVKIVEILKIINLPTQSVTRLIYSLNSFASGGDISSGRNIIYNQTIEVIKENILFGSGIFGYIGKIDYRNRNGTFYPHNIFLEILLQFGILGLFVFLTIIFIIIKKIYTNRKRNYKIDSIYFVFIISSLKLLLSNSYLFDMYFWFTLLIPFNKSYYKKIKLKKITLVKKGYKNEN